MKCVILKMGFDSCLSASLNSSTIFIYIGLLGIHIRRHPCNQALGMDLSVKVSGGLVLHYSCLC